MNLQQQVAEIRSLAPIQALNPIFSVQRKPWYKIYRYTWIYVGPNA